MKLVIGHCMQAAGYYLIKRTGNAYEAVLAVVCYFGGAARWDCGRVGGAA